MTVVPMEYLKNHVPEEYSRRMKIIEMGMMNAKQASDKKRKMIERVQWKKRKVMLSDNFGI